MNIVATCFLNSYLCAHTLWPHQSLWWWLMQKLTAHRSVCGVCSYKWDVYSMSFLPKVWGSLRTERWKIAGARGQEDWTEAASSGYAWLLCSRQLWLAALTSKRSASMEHSQQWSWGAWPLGCWWLLEKTQSVFSMGVGPGRSKRTFLK